MYSMATYSSKTHAMASEGFTQLLWVSQRRRRRYRARAKSRSAHEKLNHSYLTRLEENRDYQRLLARLVKLSDEFQRSLTVEQRRTWLMFEDAILDHAWFLHAYSFNAGYELGKTTPQRSAARAYPRQGVVNELEQQALLLSALAKVIERLVDARR
ncbi:MAG TPA: hypothetical protein VFU02_06930 [Polyangiaceae bacterium]|nr:hypothetical protein [Polyangiaceae bacterium]